MSAKTLSLTDEYINRNDLAAFLGKNPRTLDNWSVRRIGPARINVGGRKLYRISEVRRWLNSLEQANSLDVRKTA